MHLFSLPIPHQANLGKAICFIRLKKSSKDHCLSYLSVPIAEYFIVPFKFVHTFLKR